MKQTIRFNLPARPLGQINPSTVSGASFVMGYPNKRPIFGGFLQVDGHQPVAVLTETFTDIFGPYIQIDGLQPVTVLTETYVSPFSNTLQVDGFQAVAVLMET